MRARGGNIKVANRSQGCRVQIPTRRRRADGVPSAAMVRDPTFFNSFFRARLSAFMRSITFGDSEVVGVSIFLPSALRRAAAASVFALAEINTPRPLISAQRLMISESG